MRKLFAIALTGLIGLSALIPVASADNWYSRPGASERQRLERLNDSRTDNGRHLGWYKNGKYTKYDSSDSRTWGRSSVRGSSNYRGYSSRETADINRRLAAIRAADAGSARQRLQKDFYRVYPDWGR